MTREASFQEVGEGLERRPGSVNIFDVYGRKIAFKTDSPEVEDEILKDLADFRPSSKPTSGPDARDCIVYGFIEDDETRLQQMSVPPPGAILVWKSLDHNQVHYQLGDTIIMSHAKDGQLTAVTFLYVSKNLTACFARDSNSLYEICLFEIEKFASRLLEPDGKFLIHASSVDFNGRGLLFPAMSGFGKTFLTLVLLDHSYKLLSDDKTFVDTERMIIYPYSRRLRVDINSMKRFRNLRSFLGTATERRFLNYKAKYFIDAESAWPGARSRTLSTLSLVVFPTFWMGEATRVVPSKTEDTLSRLMTSLRLFRQELSLQEKQAALDIAARIPAYHLMMGTNISEIEKAIRTLIESPQRESSGS